MVVPMRWLVLVMMLVVPMVCVIEGLVKQRRVRVRLLSVFVVARAKRMLGPALVLVSVLRSMWMSDGKNWKDVKPRWMRKTRL